MTQNETPQQIKIGTYIPKIQIGLQFKLCNFAKNIYPLFAMHPNSVTNITALQRDLNYANLVTDDASIF